VRAQGVAALVPPALAALVLAALAAGIGCHSEPAAEPAAAAASPPVARRPSPPPPPRRRPPRVPARPRRRPPARHPALRPLSVPGFPVSTYVEPTGAGRRQPVLVLLHGSYNARDEECRIWHRAGAARFGWLYCPVGVPRRDAPADEERYTFSSVSRVLLETRAAFRVLRARFGDRIADGGHTLVGFSLGALLAPEVASLTRGVYSGLVLVEGVARFHRRRARQLAARGVRRVAFLCGARSHTLCPESAKRRAWYLRRAGIRVRIFTMPGTGHAHPRPFAPLAQRVLTWVRDQRRDRRRRRRGRRRSRRRAGGTRTTPRTLGRGH